MSYENEFLKSCLKIDVTAICIDSLKIKGTLINFDRYSITIKTPNEDILLYKNLIVGIKKDK